MYRSRVVRSEVIHVMRFMEPMFSISIKSKVKNLVNATGIFNTAGCTAAPEIVMSNFCGKGYIRFKIDFWLRGKRASFFSGMYISVYRDGTGGFFAHS
jgi:hypothetical protein